MQAFSRIPYTLLFTLISSHAPASQPDQADDDLFFDIPIVLSASRLEQPVSESPLAVSTIDRHVIEASGARNIPELLRLVPGVVVAKASSEFGDEPQYVVAYHGHSDQYSRRMQVLIDGRSIYEPILGGVNWNTIPINVADIERIEVIRGPNAASFGANSFLAVVNIITRHATEDQGHYVQAAAGNHEIRDVTYRFGGSAQKNIDYRVTLTSQHDDGQDRQDGVENHDGTDANMLDYRIDIQIDDLSTLTWQGGYGRTEQEVEENFATLGIRPARESVNINAFQFLKWEYTLDDENTIVTQYYLNYHDRDDVSLSKTFDPSALGITADPFQLTLDFSLRSRRHNFEFTHFNSSLDATRIIWGASSQLEQIESPYFLGPGNKIDRRTNRLFVNVEHEINREHLLQFGTLYESNAFDGDSYSPRFSYVYRPHPDHSLRYSISRAIRQPFVLESNADAFFTHDLTSGGTPTGLTLYYQQLLASPGLMTESILSKDIGYYGKLADGSMTINLRVFEDALSDLLDRATIFTAPNDNVGIGTTTFTNQADSTIKGVEMEFDLRATPSVRILGNIATADIDSNISILRESAPKRSATLMGIFDLGDRLTLSTSLIHITDMAFIDVNNTTTSGENTGDYTVMDVRLGKTFRISQHDVNLSLTAKNLLDEYNAYDANPTNGPRLEENLTWYLELKVRHH